MEEKKSEYLVLARKYRPKTFEGLIGQETMVRTIFNAIEMNRVAHSFILTGIRGVGKTTSARIIAKALNCVEGPTAKPCDVCDQCVSISEGRNVDVIETDAASRTGVGDMREIIDNVMYLPVSARYKIYIIDEVHMLSKSAFNALLKTLEEPPSHVKFIFATTEIRKIPLTILSRCQRFDLARVETAVLAKRLVEIAEIEKYQLEPAAAAIIAKAAEGSVRDALSILDRALSSSSGVVSEGYIRELLGISDSNNIFELFNFIAGGEIAAALKFLRELYHKGSEVSIIFEDLLELSHFLTQIKINPDSAEFSSIADSEIKQARELAEGLSIPFLVRFWQVTLKGIGEIRIAPNPITAAEMLVVKLGYASELPTPSDLIKKIKSGNISTPITNPKPQISSHAPAREPELLMAVKHLSQAAPQNFADLLKLFEAHEPLLCAHLSADVHLISFEKNRLEIRPTEKAPKDLAGRIVDALLKLTGERVIVTISNEKGEKTIREKTIEAEQTERTRIENLPLVKAALEAFPGSKITAVNKIESTKTEKKEVI